MVSDLLKKVDDKHAVIGVVGMGYVGLPLLLCFVEKGFHAVGLDIDGKKCEMLMKGQSYIKHIPSERIKNCADSGLLRTSTDFAAARDCRSLSFAAAASMDPTSGPSAQPQQPSEFDPR